VSAAGSALDAIALRKRAEVDQLRCAEAALWAKAELLPPARGLVNALRRGTVIAEMKRRSPSGGALRPDLDALAVACTEEARWEFLFTVAPLVLRRGTASPVNPIALF